MCQVSGGNFFAPSWFFSLTFNKFHILVPIYFSNFLPLYSPPYQWEPVTDFWDFPQDLLLSLLGVPSVTDSWESLSVFQSLIQVFRKACRVDIYWALTICQDFLDVLTGSDCCFSAFIFLVLYNSSDVNLSLFYFTGNCVGISNW